jgi:hypothetical protein
MHFGTKSYLKNTRNHTAKNALNQFKTYLFLRLYRALKKIEIIFCFKLNFLVFLNHFDT